MFGISLTRFPRQRIYKTPPVAIAPEGRDGSLKSRDGAPKGKTPPVAMVLPTVAMVLQKVEMVL